MRVFLLSALFALQSNLGFAFFTDPGVATWQNGEWVGNEHLFNIPKEISVKIKVMKEPSLNVTIDEGALQKKVEELFKKEGITLKESVEPTSPLPIFNVQIFIYPADHSDFIACIARFLEDVDIKRVKLSEKVVFQAATWQREAFIVSPPEQVQAQISQTVSRLVEGFAERYRHFQAKRS